MAFVDLADVEVVAAPSWEMERIAAPVESYMPAARPDYSEGGATI